MTIQRIKEIAFDRMVFSQINIDDESTKEELLYFAGYNDGIGSLIRDLELESASENEEDENKIQADDLQA